MIQDSADLQLFGAFDHLLEAEGKTDHMRVGNEVKATWLRFINGQDPWNGAFEGIAATFTIDGTGYGTTEQARGWSEERRHRMDRLSKVDFLQLVEVATVVFP